MAKSRKLSPREMQELRKYQEQYENRAAKANNVKSVKKTSKNYKAARGTIIRLKAAVLLLIASAGAIYKMAEDARTPIEEKNITVGSFVSTQERQSAEIEIDGNKFELDMNSFAIIEGEITQGENNTLAYDENGNVLEGNVDSENLKGIIELAKEEWKDSGIYRVISEVGANLAQKGEEVTKISFGDFVLGKEQEDEFVEVLYPNGDEILTGEIEGQALEKVNEVYTDYQLEEENQQKVDQVQNESTFQAVNLSNVEDLGITNMSGTITGIDVSGMTPNQLRQILKFGVPTAVVKDNGVIVNTNAAAGKINFVHIKLGASPYTNRKFEPKENENCKELVQICEEFDVPYGFYYYSTATNIEQAEIEAQFTIGQIKEMQNEIDMKNNIMPISIDVELSGKHDVHLGKDIGKIADAKAHYINKIQESGISEKVLFYTTGRLVMNPNERQEYADSFIDLKRIKEKVNNQDDFAVWLCAPTNRDGTTPQSTKEYYDMIEQEIGIEVVNRQVTLDVSSTYGGLLDINTMSKEYYMDCIEEKENDVVLQSLEEDYEI